MGKWKHRLSNIDPVNLLANCSECGCVEIILKDSRWKCKIARKLQRGDLDYRRRKSLEYYHRNRPQRIVDRCEICEKEKPLCWDHDHETGLHRGWLCHGCNVGIGFLEDDVGALKAAIKYLERTKAP